MITVSNLSKAFGDNQVLSGVSLQIGRGERRGVVGANGVGKSTLVKIIAGELEPDSGIVQVAAGVTLGYLPQVLSEGAALTVDELLASAQARVLALETQLRSLEAAMAGGQPAGDELARYGLLVEEYEALGGYDLDHRTEVMLEGLGLGALPRDRIVATLSGGEKARVGLAALLLRSPDLLLLDEPTNHLDFAALDWLEDFLRRYRGAVLVVSHDRQFLNAVVEAIVEIDEHSKEARYYPGNYDYFAAEKGRARLKWEADYAAQQEEMHELRRMIRTSARQVAHNRPPTDSDGFVYAFKGGRVDGTVARNVHAAEEKLRRIEDDPIPKPPRPLQINPEFDPAELMGKTPLAVSQVCKRYGERQLLDEITFALGPRDRIAIVGANGVGKSTLLKLLARRITPDSGSITVAPSVVVGYLDQEQETLARTGTLYEAYSADRTGDWEQLKVELLRYGLFVYPDLAKPVAALSVGQQRKLQIARLMAERANVLLLDEPTNHISFDVLEEFEQALLDFPGPLIAISHDRRFLARVAGEIWELCDGKLIRYLGGWEAYRRERSGK